MVLTLRGIRIGSPIPGDLVEPAKSSELDTTTTDLELVCNSAWVPVRGGVKIIDERVVEVVGCRAARVSCQYHEYNCQSVTHKYCLCPRKACPARARM